MALEASFVHVPARSPRSGAGLGLRAPGPPGRPAVAAPPPRLGQASWPSAELARMVDAGRGGAVYAGAGYASGAAKGGAGVVCGSAAAGEGERGRGAPGGRGKAGSSQATEACVGDCSGGWSRSAPSASERTCAVQSSRCW